MLGRRPATELLPVAALSEVSSTEFEPEQLHTSETWIRHSKGWQSQGGASVRHPYRAFPTQKEFCVPPGHGRTTRIELIGVFAITTEVDEVFGTRGARIDLQFDDGSSDHIDLIHGRHYCDSRLGPTVCLVPGDGTSLETVGSATARGEKHRVDALRIDVPEDRKLASFRFRDLGTPASFVLFDARLQTLPQHGCPFHSSAQGVALTEIPAIVRVMDRSRMKSAVESLRSHLTALHDLDEARGISLTFLAMVVAASLESGGSRDMHVFQLQAARAVDSVETVAQVANLIEGLIRDAVPQLFCEQKGQNDVLMDKAMAYVNRNFAKQLRDSDVANVVGLSTSHFRHLFKEATGQPFHQFLLALRLERAKTMICQDNVSVTEAARAAGFGALSHFSRAFVDRFAVRPSEVKAIGLYLELSE